ncbi:manganese-dependent ADP-ribose/CDP-alcohol diphosphatase-like isoform X2 [Ambystoma mexicanum]|uniref:manganese-dependent ADP-ribose/CDP-alcohol diphosphatase-like isoform X2 n=1 Tax=Ambystoma mexicanum TaxID=8296 RepID=UPI0037E96BAE
MIWLDLYVMIARLQETCLKSICLECEENNDGPQLCFTFGVIADIQYADKGDALSFWKTGIRYYRNSYHLLQSAIEEWNSEANQPGFVLQLGDIIDGVNVKLKTSQSSLDKLLREIEKSKAPFHHVWGNHELYNFNRDYLIHSKLNTKVLEDTSALCSSTSPTCSPNNSDPMQFYAYHFSPFPKFRFIIVDTYDLSILGLDRTSRKYQQSWDFLMQDDNPENANDLKDRCEEYCLEFNGGFSKEQLEWLNEVLTFADQNKEKVVIAGHVPIHPGAKHGHCLAWNYTAILSVLHAHACVVCYIAGHDHSGGYCVDDKGIHHLTLEGVIETPPGSHAFATVYMYDNKMIIHGRGRTPSRELEFRK